MPLDTVTIPLEPVLNGAVASPCQIHLVGWSRFGLLFLVAAKLFESLVSLLAKPEEQIAFYPYNEAHLMTLTALHDESGQWLRIAI